MNFVVSPREKSESSRNVLTAAEKRFTAAPVKMLIAKSLEWTDLVALALILKRSKPQLQIQTSYTVQLLFVGQKQLKSHIF